MFSFGSGGGGAEDARLPLIARLTLYALGAIEGRRIRRPIDPVAAWLVRNHPAMVEGEPAPAAYATVRARTSLIDELLGEEVVRAERLERRIALWSFGGGFDARWYRQMPMLSRVVDSYHEVETPGLMGRKDLLISKSPYGTRWQVVQQEPMPVGEWNLGDTGDREVLVLLEGLAGRLEPKRLKALLGRLKEHPSSKRILMGLPAYNGQTRAWSVDGFEKMGFRVDVDVRLTSRGRLVAQSGKEICAGMHGLRVVRLTEA